MNNQVIGLITKSQSGFYSVHCKHGVIQCKLRGHLNHKRISSNLAAIGDNVTINLLDDGTGIITNILERKSFLSRNAPKSTNDNIPKHRYHQIEQVLIANPDQAILVFACVDPKPNLRMLDRFLVITEANHIPAIICINKIDDSPNNMHETQFRTYEKIGYKVIYISTFTNKNMVYLREVLSNKISVLLGPSGVGKSSILNALNPNLNLPVDEISRKNKKGKHTTVYPQLIPLDNDSWLADTPGLKALDFYDIEPEELDAYFREVAPLVSQCSFSNCSHTHEPNCAIVEAVNAGQITNQRYNSLIQMKTK